MPKVVLLADRTRPGVEALISDVRRQIEQHATIVGELAADSRPWPDDLEADLGVVLGGDGSLISQARRVVEQELPLIGLNFGRLGFLAEFELSTLEEHAETVFGPDPPIQEHVVLSAEIQDAGGRTLTNGLAVNECVITAGPPFRMIEIAIRIDGAEGPTLRGDGVIVATPAGSTAYNVSAGGPIVHREVPSLIITPLAAHSLAFRPIVAPAHCVLTLSLTKANLGTTLVLDGQVALPIRPGMTTIIRRHPRNVRFVVNPASTYWGILRDKMHWAATPTYRDRG